MISKDTYAYAETKAILVTLLTEDTDVKRTLRQIAWDAAQEWWNDDMRLGEAEVDYVRDRIDIPGDDEIDERINHWWNDLDNDSVEECVDQAIEDNDMKLSDNMDKAVRTVVQSELSTLVEKAMTHQQQG